MTRYFFLNPLRRVPACEARGYACLQSHQVTGSDSRQFSTRCSSYLSRRYIPSATFLRTQLAMAGIAGLLQEVRDSPNETSWSTKWQIACENLWETLSRGQPVDNACIELFINLLGRSDRFALARMIIPDLRRDILPANLRPIQRHIIGSVNDLRTEVLRRESTTQNDFDDPLYIAEKRIFIEAQVHRASVLLHEAGAFGSAERAEIEEWWLQRPGGNLRREEEEEEEEEHEHIAREQ